MHVLGRMVEAVRPDGIILDLQVTRPNPRVEIDGRILCEVDGSPLFRTADAATAAVDALVDAGRLFEKAVDDHDVRARSRLHPRRAPEGGVHAGRPGAASTRPPRKAMWKGRERPDSNPLATCHVPPPRLLTAIETVASRRSAQTSC